MDIKSKTVVVDSYRFYRIHLEILNVLLNVKLSEREMDILAAFFSLDEKDIAGYLFSTQARKEAKKKLGGMSSGNLANHIRSLIEKGFLKRGDNNVIEYQDFLKPETDAQGYQILLRKNEDI